jgi:hypothetical protein
MADASYDVLEPHTIPLLGEWTGGVLSKFSPTFAAILMAVLAEALLGRFTYGKWPHLASSFVSGISAGILIKSPEVWPFVACALISITSKYALREEPTAAFSFLLVLAAAVVLRPTEELQALRAALESPHWEELRVLLGRMLPALYLAAFVPLAYGLLAVLPRAGQKPGEERHLWNPTNLGMTVMLWLAWDHCHSLGVEAGNEWAAAVVIWILGGLILYQLGRLHQPVAFVLAFVPLAFLRSRFMAQPINWLYPFEDWLPLGGRLPVPWTAELTPITSPMFQLFIFFMITDPKTTTKSKWSQTVVVLLVAVMETVYRVAFRDVHSLYHSLFTVGPLANVIEIAYFRLKGGAAKEAGPAPATAPAAWGLAGEAVTPSARPTTG